MLESDHGECFRSSGVVVCRAEHRSGSGSHVLRTGSHMTPMYGGRAVFISQFFLLVVTVTTSGVEPVTALSVAEIHVGCVARMKSCGENTCGALWSSHYLSWSGSGFVRSGKRSMIQNMQHIDVL